MAEPIERNSFIISESEKYNDDNLKVKERFNYYQQVGLEQVNKKKIEFRKLYELRHGIINPAEYIPSDNPEPFEEVDGDGFDDNVIEFYPIIPTVINFMTNHYSKMATKFTVNCVDEDSINEMVEKKSTDVTEMLVGLAKNSWEIQISADMLSQTPQEQLNEEQLAQYNEQQKAYYEEQMQIFQKLPAIEAYYKNNYRSEIVEWAVHSINNDDARFNMRRIARKLFDDYVTFGERYCHLLFDDTRYTPEVLNPESVFYIKGENVEDVSEAMVVGFIQKETINTILNKFALTAEQVEKISSWGSSNKYGSNLMMDDFQTRPIEGGITHRKPYHSSMNNWLYMDRMNKNAKIDFATGTKNFRLAFEETSENTFTGMFHRECMVTTQYMNIPRKMGKLIAKLEGDDIGPIIVTDDFKVTVKPKYASSKKTAENLVYGEHIDWFYINEVWRVVKITNSNILGTMAFGGATSNDLDADNIVWLECCPLKFQLKPEMQLFGSLIPVFGGPTTSRTPTRAMKPWQKMYNFTMNKVNQLQSFEIGKFYPIDQNIIPKNSIDGSWGKNNWFKFFDIAKDVSIVPVDASMNNTGLPMSNTFQQSGVVDLTNTEQIDIRMRLATYLKQECWGAIGLSPQALADISPTETATGVKQAVASSITLLQHYYNEHADFMRRFRQGMLDVAQYIQYCNPELSMSYINSDKGVEIFKNDLGINVLTKQLSIYAENNPEEVELLMQLKQVAMADNTLRADDRIDILTSNSVQQIYQRIKNNITRQEKQQEAEMQNQKEMQQQQIEAVQQQEEMRLKEEKEQFYAKLENDYNIAELNSYSRIGQYGDGATDTVDNKGYMELDKLRQQREIESNKLFEARNANDSKMKVERDKMNNSREIEIMKMQIEREKLANDRFVEKLRAKTAIRNKTAGEK